MAAGICQRDVTQHFPALRDQQDDLEERILEFFEEHIQHKFPSADCELLQLANHCMNSRLWFKQCNVLLEEQM